MIRLAMDIDDTLYKVDRKYNRQVPDFDLIQVLKWFYNNGDEIYIWSAGGIDYAQMVVDKLGLTDYVKVISKERRTEIDLTFDDEEVILGKVNVHIKRVPDTTILYVDGGCLGNSQKDLSKRKMVWVVTDEKGKVLVEEIAEGGSNNIAEFVAIKSAFEYCIENKITEVKIFSDSRCAIAWYYAGPKGKKMNNKKLVLEIEKEINSLRKKIGNVLVKQIPREESLAGHYIEKKYCL